MGLICWWIDPSDEPCPHMNAEEIHPIGSLNRLEFRHKTLGLFEKGIAGVDDDLDSIRHLDRSAPSGSLGASEERIQDHQTVLQSTVQSNRGR
jgi:hypothetical protein